MIKINLSDTRRIISDDSQFCLQKLAGKRKDPKTDEVIDKWESYAYYVSLRACLHGYAQWLLRNSDATTFPELLVDMDKIQAQLSEWESLKLSDWRN